MTWRPHPDHEGNEGILVSDDGVVFDVRKPAILPQYSVNKNGHRTVWCRGKSRYVHHLVLETYVGPRPPGMYGLHDNDIGYDNRATNLHWGTQSQNGKEAVANGRNVNVNKTHCKWGHEFTEDNIYRCGKTGRRDCVTCRRIRGAARRAAKRAVV